MYVAPIRERELLDLIDRALMPYLPKDKQVILMAALDKFEREGNPEA